MRNAEKLTPLQLGILRFIGDYRRQHGYAPSIREISIFAGHKHGSRTSYHVDILVLKGYLKKDIGVARSLRLTGKHIEVKE